MKIIIVTQARLGSSRLPNKVLLKVGEETMLSLHLKRLMKSELASDVIVATTREKGIEPVLEICNKLNVKFFQGDLNDVLDRFYNAVKNEKADLIVRVTSDCPLIDPKLIDTIVKIAIDKKVDYCSNIITEDFPDGQDIEVFTFKSLKKTWKEAKLKSEREHVTPYIRNNSDLNGGKLFTAFDVKCHSNFNTIRMTVDEEADFIVIQQIINKLGVNRTWEEYADYIIKNSDSIVNTNIVRNEGYIKSLIKD